MLPNPVCVHPWLIPLCGILFCLKCGRFIRPGD